MSNESIDLRKPSSDRAMYRRGIVKRLMLEKGVTNRAEIRRILKLEYGLDVTRQCIYKDIEAISKLSMEDIEEFELDITSVYKKQIRDQIGEIKHCKDAKLRSDLRKVLSSLMKDQQSVLSSMYVRGAGKDAVDKADGERPRKIFSISFDEGKVADQPLEKPGDKKNKKKEVEE